MYYASADNFSREATARTHDSEVLPISGLALRGMGSACAAANSSSPEDSKHASPAGGSLQNGFPGEDAAVPPAEIEGARKDLARAIHSGVVVSALVQGCI